MVAFAIFLLEVLLFVLILRILYSISTKGSVGKKAFGIVLVVALVALGIWPIMSYSSYCTAHSWDVRTCGPTNLLP